MNIKSKLQAYKRQLVLEKVSQLFEQKGFETVKMADIANYCDISVGALYKLFASKEDLFYEYVSYQIDLFHSKLQDRFGATEDPNKRLLIFTQTLFETFLQKKIILLDTIAGDPLFFAKLSVKKGNPAKKIYQLLETEFAKIPNKQIEDNTKLAILFKSFLYGYIEYWLLLDKPIQDLAQEAINLFLRGILKE